MAKEPLGGASMIRLAISVEGETEEEFVKQALADYLRPSGVEPIPYLLMGNVSVPRLSGEMARLLPDHDAVTSLVDFYGFQGKNRGESAEELEGRVLIAIRSNPRIMPASLPVKPYVQRHEFEGLLFSDVETFEVLPNVLNAALERLRGIRECFTTPEDINDSSLTAPSKRISEAIPGYSKRVHGPLLAEEIGLDRMRAECPRFNDWLTWIEALGNLVGQV